MSVVLRHPSEMVKPENEIISRLEDPLSIQPHQHTWLGRLSSHHHHHHSSLPILVPPEPRSRKPGCTNNNCMDPGGNPEVPEGTDGLCQGGKILPFPPVAVDKSMELDQVEGRRRNKRKCQEPKKVQPTLKVNMGDAAEAKDLSHKPSSPIFGIEASKDQADGDESNTAVQKSKETASSEAKPLWPFKKRFRLEEVSCSEEGPLTKGSASIVDDLIDAKLIKPSRNDTPSPFRPWDLKVSNLDHLGPGSANHPQTRRPEGNLIMPRVASGPRRESVPADVSLDTRGPDIIQVSTPVSQNLNLEAQGQVTNIVTPAELLGVPLLAQLVSASSPLFQMAHFGEMRTLEVILQAIIALKSGPPAHAGLEKAPNSPWSPPEEQEEPLALVKKRNIDHFEMEEQALEGRRWSRRKSADASGTTFFDTSSQMSSSRCSSSSSPSSIKENNEASSNQQEGLLPIGKVRARPSGVAADVKVGIENSTQEHDDQRRHKKDSTKKRGPQRNYKNMTRERRVEANARERQRVHTITAAYDTLHSLIPTCEEDLEDFEETNIRSVHHDNQPEDLMLDPSGANKLSKLSIIKIAISYITLLARVLGHDYTQDHSAPSVKECLQSCLGLLGKEAKSRKKDISSANSDDKVFEDETCDGDDKDL